MFMTFLTILEMLTFITFFGILQWNVIFITKYIHKFDLHNVISSITFNTIYFYKIKNWIFSLKNNEKQKFRLASKINLTILSGL